MDQDACNGCRRRFAANFTQVVTEYLLIADLYLKMIKEYDLGIFDQNRLTGFRRPLFIAALTEFRSIRAEVEERKRKLEE